MVSINLKLRRRRGKFRIRLGLFQRKHRIRQRLLADTHRILSSCGRRGKQFLKIKHMWLGMIWYVNITWRVVSVSTAWGEAISPRPSGLDSREIDGDSLWETLYSRGVSCTKEDPAGETDSWADWVCAEANTSSWRGTTLLKQKNTYFSNIIIVSLPLGKRTASAWRTWSYRGTPCLGHYSPNWSRPCLRHWGGHSRKRLGRWDIKLSRPCLGHCGHSVTVERQLVEEWLELLVLHYCTI